QAARDPRRRPARAAPRDGRGSQARLPGVRARSGASGKRSARPCRRRSQRREPEIGRDRGRLARRVAPARGGRPRARRGRGGNGHLRRRLDKMEPLAPQADRPVVGGEWSAPTHLSWVAGRGPGRATYGASPTLYDSTTTVTVGLDVDAHSIGWRRSTPGGAGRCRPLVGRLSVAHGACVTALSAFTCPCPYQEL